MKDKGYVFTISTFFLMSSVLLLALFFSTRTDETDISGPKLGALYDDIRQDIFEMLNMSVVASSAGNFTVVVFNETLPAASDIRGRLGRYEEYVEKVHTSHVGIDLENRAGSPAGADVSMNLHNPVLYLRPYAYLLDHNDLSKREVLLYPRENNTNLLGFALNLSIGENLSISEDAVRGGWPVRISVVFTNGTYEFNTNISRTEASRWSLELPNATGSLNLTLGRVLADGEWKNSTFAMLIDRVEGVNSSMAMVFKRSRFVLESGFTITLRDILGYRRAKRGERPLTDIVDYTRIKDNIWFTIEKRGEVLLPLYVPPPEEESVLPGPPPPPVLLGYCYCAAPCYYWEEYWEGDMPCEFRPCPDWCEPNMTMMTFLL